MHIQVMNKISIGAEPINKTRGIKLTLFLVYD
jgi:hypothetical protein